MNLGKRLEDLRRKRGLATGELAARAKVTSGFISQLEHNKTSPSLTTLQRVAAALDVPLTYLLLEDDLLPQVVRKHERQGISLGQDGLCASLVSPLLSQHLEVVVLDLPPGTVSWPQSRSHEGQECHLVLRGTIRAYYGEESYLLDEGDSILWDGTVPHRMENVGDGAAQLLIALAPAAFLRHADEGRAQRSAVSPDAMTREERGAAPRRRARQGVASVSARQRARR
jgi:transcriptional regulator with XRE-family HTH domain